MYEIKILDHHRKPLSIVENYLSLQYTRRWQKKNSFSLTISKYAKSSQYIKEDYYLDVKRNKQSEFTSLLEHGEIQLDQSGKISENWEVHGSDVISRRICEPPSGLSHDARSGSAEAVLKGYINANIINPSNLNRKIDGIVNEPNANRGNSVSYQARYNPLVDVLEDISRAGEIGWELVGSGEGQEFKIIPGQDKSTRQSIISPIIFSPDFGNIELVGYQWSMLDRATYAYVAGQGEGANREIINVFLNGEPTGLQRRETFIDARDLDNTTQLQQRGFANLDEQGDKERLEARILTKGPFKYRKDWDLGDIVTVRNLDWSIVAHLRVTEITITLEPNKPEQIGVVFGAPFPNFLQKIKRETKKPGPAMRI